MIPRRRNGAGPDEAVRPVLLWFALLGGFVAWVLHLGVSYSVVPLVCGTAGGGVLHALTGATALVAAAAGWSGWTAYRKLEGVDEEPDLGAPERVESAPARHRRGSGAVEGPRPPTRAPLPDPVDIEVRTQRFLALSGLLASGFFLGLILVEGLPALIQDDPCAFIPTLDQPIILHEQGPVLGGVAVEMGSVNPLFGTGTEAFWAGWTLDPWVLFPAYLFCLVYLTGVARLWKKAGRGRGLPGWRVAAYLAGIGALLIALVSPVHAIGEALFSVHMVQHLLLMVVAAPLLVLGRPSTAFLWALPSGGLRRLGKVARADRVRAAWRVIVHPISVLALHIGALWLWHLPALYEAALRLRWVHHLEHASFFLTAVLFWWILTRAGGRWRWPGYGAGILYVFATTLQSGALGALILFAPEPWYAPHVPGAALWGVDPMTDQQVAGVLMWVPPGLVYALAAMLLLVAWIRTAEETVERRERAGWELIGADLTGSAAANESPEGRTA